MRRVLALALLPAAALAQPRSLGTFDDWRAATTGSGAQTVCYATTTVKSSRPDTVARQGNVTLTVTHRPGSRDEVALHAGFAYPANAAVTLRLAGTSLNFYTNGAYAYARDRRGAVAAFRRAGEVVADSPQPRGNARVADTFSLRGFQAAYQRISEECRAR